jgi:hypothetical protein
MLVVSVDQQALPRGDIPGKAVPLNILLQRSMVFYKNPRRPAGARAARHGQPFGGAGHLVGFGGSLHRLLDLVEVEFEPLTVRAFRRLALDGASGAETARELGMSVGAVYVAKSRVLQRIGLETEDLID